MVVCSPLRALRLVRQLAVVFIAIGSAAAAASAQTTVTLGTPGTHINADLMVQGGSAAYTDFSDTDILATKVSSAAYTRRMFFKFDTQNNIPANAVIHSAYLYLTLRKAENSGTGR